MALVFEVGGLPLSPDFTAALSDVLTEQCSLTNHSFVIEVSNLDMQGMEQLNSEQRSKSQPTDVLSFPLFPNLSTILQQVTPEVPLGNLVTCADYAREQGTALEELILHGSLHLLGFDHEADLATWRGVEQASIAALARRGITLTGIEKGYL